MIIIIWLEFSSQYGHLAATTAPTSKGSFYFQSTKRVDKMNVSENDYIINRDNRSWKIHLE
jgi:hypothetical protein